MRHSITARDEKLDSNIQGREEAIAQFINEQSNTEHSEDALAIATHYLNGASRHPDFDDNSLAILEPFVSKNLSKPKFAFIDLFAGIGGFRVALETLGGKSVFSSEWEKNAKQTYLKNHNEFPFGDINRFTGEDLSDNRVGSLIPSHEILAAGFPCQPFSLAGVSARNSLGLSHGLECTTQGTLFRSIERIARIKQPKVLLLENVKNLVSHDSGRTFTTIKNAIESAGYNFQHMIVNSSSLTPQRRLRCFMVCVRNDICQKFGEFQFPIFDDAPLPLSSILEKNPDPKFTISQRLWEGHQNRSARNKARGTGFQTATANLSSPSNTIVARYGKDGKECLIAQDNLPPRTLTIDECRKLFGYPDNFQLPTAKTVAFKLLGNSVVVPAVRKISMSILQQYFEDRAN